MVTCAACGTPILSYAHNGMHIKCYRIHKGRKPGPRKWNKKRPEGYVRGKNRIAMQLHMSHDLFDRICDDYMASEFDGSFSAYVCSRIEGSK